METGEFRLGIVLRGSNLLSYCSFRTPIDPVVCLGPFAIRSNFFFDGIRSNLLIFYIVLSII